MVTECSFLMLMFGEIILGEQQSLAEVPAGSWMLGTAFLFLNNTV